MGKKLGALVRAKMTANNLSARDVSRQSGGIISHTTISAAAKGLPHKTFERRTLHALASALGIPSQDILAAYDEDMAQAEPMRLVLPPHADTLSAAGRRALIAHLEWLLEQERQLAREQVKRGRRSAM